VPVKNRPAEPAEAGRKESLVDEELVASKRITVELASDQLVKLEAATATLAKMARKAGTNAVKAKWAWTAIYQSMPDGFREPVLIGREDARLRLIWDDARRRNDELSLAADILRIVLTAVYSKEG
jgi:hypothetical protein